MGGERSSAGVATATAEFCIVRVFDAPPSTVFKAWTDPKELAKWWGPRGFTSTIEMDVKVGGAFTWMMHVPEDLPFPFKTRDLACTGVFREISPPHKLVLTMDMSSHPQEWHDMVNKRRPNSKANIGEVLYTITFEDLNGKTKLTILCKFNNAEDRDAMVNMGMTEGWSQSLEKLQAAVAKTVQPNSLEVRKILKAPVHLVWQAWTQPEHMQKWWGCAQCIGLQVTQDFRVGGQYRIVMDLEDGTDMTVWGKFEEIVENTKLSFTWSNNRQDFPATDTVVTIDFIDKGATTEVVLKHTRFTFSAGAEGHTVGWQASLDKLEALFEKSA